MARVVKNLLEIGRLLRGVYTDGSSFAHRVEGLATTFGICDLLKFIIYMLNEMDYWFDRLGETVQFSSADELKAFLKKLVDEYLDHWKKWMKSYRP